MPDSKNEWIETLSATLASMPNFQNTQDQQAKRQIASTLLSGMGVSAVNMGLAVAQIVKGAQKLKGAKEPRYPRMLTKNPLLQQRLAQAKRDASQINPQLQRERERVANQAFNKDDATAKKSGGNYAALTQGNALDKAELLRKGAFEDEQLKRSYKGLYDGLIGQDIRENQLLHQNKIGQYNSQYRRYQQDLQHGNALSNMGMQNLLATANNTTENLPPLISYYRNLKKNKKPAFDPNPALYDPSTIYDINGGMYG